MSASSLQLTPSPARRLAFEALKAIYQGGYADVVLNRLLSQHRLGSSDRALATELVYGSVRRQRTLDALIDQLGKKTAQQQPLPLRIVLHLGLYQLRYLSHMPPSAAVHTSVELAKVVGQKRLAGVVNGILRQYQRLQAETEDPLRLPENPITALAIRHSFPDWLVQHWWDTLGDRETDALCGWFNQSPAIDLRVNPLRTSVAAVAAALAEVGLATQRLSALPHGLRLLGPAGAIQQLPGYEEGWWLVQDASAQWVSHLVDPQPGQVVIDACAAPGGKATHLAMLMNDQGTVWACDRTPSRLRRVEQNAQRLGLSAVHPWAGDSTEMTQFEQQGDRVLVDAPCSGLGTLHRHADARWRQTPATIAELTDLQARLLARAATWVKPGGTLVYATCTLYPAENEAQIEQFLQQHPDWCIVPPAPDTPLAAYSIAPGWVKIWPHHHAMDGFFMVRLGQREALPNNP